MIKYTATLLGPNNLEFDIDVLADDEAEAYHEARKILDEIVIGKMSLV